jgi:hypothetical protein
VRRNSARLRRGRRSQARFARVRIPLCPSCALRVATQSFWPLAAPRLALPPIPTRPPHSAADSPHAGEPRGCAVEHRPKLGEVVERLTVEQRRTVNCIGCMKSQLRLTVFPRTTAAGGERRASTARKEGDGTPHVMVVACPQKNHSRYRADPHDTRSASVVQPRRALLPSGRKTTRNELVCILRSVNRHRRDIAPVSAHELFIPW